MPVPAVSSQNQRIVHLPEVRKDGGEEAVGQRELSHAHGLPDTDNIDPQRQGRDPRRWEGWA